MADPKSTSGSSASQGSVSRKNVVRKVYAYEMTARDKVALRAVLSAKNACTAIAVAIQEGKPVKPESIKACYDLQMVAADMLFA